MYIGQGAEQILLPGEGQGDWRIAVVKAVPGWADTPLDGDYGFVGGERFIGDVTQIRASSSVGEIGAKQVEIDAADAASQFLRPA